jgi:hypothetical protein
VSQKVFRAQWSSFSMRVENLSHIYDLLCGKLHIVKQSPRNQQLQKFVRAWVKRQREAVDTLNIPFGASVDDVVTWFVSLSGNAQLKTLWKMPNHFFEKSTEPLKRLIALSDDPIRVQKAIPLVIEPAWSGESPLLTSLPTFEFADKTLRPVLSAFSSIDYRKLLYPQFGSGIEFITDAVDRAMVCGAAGLSTQPALTSEQRTMVHAVSVMLASVTDDMLVDVVDFLAVFEKELLGIKTASSRAFVWGQLIQELFSGTLWYDADISCEVEAVSPFQLLISNLKGDGPIPILGDNVHSRFASMILKGVALNFIVTDDDKLIAAFYTTTNEKGEEHRVECNSWDDDAPYVAFKFTVVKNDLGDFSIPSTF